MDRLVAHQMSLPRPRSWELSLDCLRTIVGNVACNQQRKTGKPVCRRILLSCCKSWTSEQVQYARAFGRVRLRNTTGRMPTLSGTCRLLPICGQFHWAFSFLVADVVWDECDALCNHTVALRLAVESRDFLEYVGCKR